MLDPGTPFGRRADRRLHEDHIGWLTTVRPDGMPVPVPVWFLWDGTTILVFSQPRTGKLRNLEANPRASLHLNSDPGGGGIVVVTGEAAIEPDAPRADSNEAYMAKYREDVARLGTRAEAFAADYSVALRLVPNRITGF